MIIDAAILKDSTIYSGRRHFIIINNADKGFFKENSIQGFITDSGEFLDREKALEHAYKSGQISKTLYKERLKYSKELFSEDLW